MITIRFFHGNPLNPLHLIIMLVTRSRVVHCEVVTVDKYGNQEKYIVSTIQTSFGTSVNIPFFIVEDSMKDAVDIAVIGGADFVYDASIPFDAVDDIIGTPYDYRAALAYIWPWVKESPTRMNCVEVCLWAMRKAGIPTPKHLPTPGGLMRWCRKIQKEEVKP